MMGGANWTAHATLPNHLHKRQTSLRVQKNCESERLLYRNGLDVKREWEAESENCGVCSGKVRTSHIGDDFYLEGTSKVVCLDCAGRYAPDLVAIVAKPIGTAKQTDLDEMLTEISMHLSCDIEAGADENIQVLKRACAGLVDAINHVNNRLNSALRQSSASSALASDCVLCSTSDIHKGGGIFWTDSRWICPACWSKVVDLVSTDRARAEPFVRGARTF
jgi:hypothetical protein